MASDSFLRNLSNALDRVNATTTFAVGGHAHTLPLPALNVANVGPIALPLQQSQADALRAVSVQSPFGRGVDTVVDTSVRSSHEISTPSFSLGQAWNTEVQKLAQRMASNLGVASSVVSAELYKLVLYQPGDFFKPHQDTEKSPGMFATLVVQLPSIFSSAALVVSHRHERRVFDYAEGSDVYFFATAFFADCQHELKEVKGGNRLVLLYNLIRSDGRTPGRELVRHDAVLDKISRIADEWEEKEEPERFIYMLEHKYTEKNISFQKLKGNDAARVSILRQSAKFDLFLALVEKHDYGSAESNDYYSRSRGGYYDDDDEDGAGYSMQDIIESSITTTKVIAEDDVQVSMPVLKFDDEDREEWFEGLDPDKEEFEGYTGNAGPTLEYFYHCTFLFVLPRFQSFALACDESFQDGVRLVLRRVNSGAADAAETLLEAIDYANDSLSEAYSCLADLLHIACRIKHKDAAGTLIGFMDSGSNIAQGGCMSQKHVDAFVFVVRLFGWNEFGSRVIKLVRKTPTRMVKHAAALAVRVSELNNTLEPADCIAKAVVDICEAAPIDEGSVANVAKMLFRLPSCVPHRANFLCRCLEMSPAGLAACIVSVLKSYAEEDDKHGVPAKIAELCRKYMGTAFTADASKQATSHAGDVFGALLGADPRDEQLLSELSNKVVSTNCRPLLREVLRASQVREWVGDAHVKCVASARARQLRYPEPVETNAQPLAFVPRHPNVTAFLRSNARSMKYRAFVDYRHASNFARKHFWGTFNRSEKHCASAQVLGGDYDPHVIITKKDYVCEEKLKQYRQDQEELRDIQRFLGNSEVVTVDDVVKRRRLNPTEVIEID